ncbi:MAG TPA: hypothetical protein VFY91_06305, partial [Microbacterium sp.]|nr:hypothetical protein [Microbacterium sp.]
MDVLDRVREFGADIELSDDQLSRAMQEVRRGLLPDAPSRKRARLWVGIGGIGGLVAAGAATTAIVVALSAPPTAVVEAVTPS